MTEIPNTTPKEAQPKVDPSRRLTFATCTNALREANKLGFYGKTWTQPSADFLRAGGSEPLRAGSFIGVMGKKGTDEQFVFKMNAYPEVSRTEGKFLQNIAPSLTEQVRGIGTPLVVPQVVATDLSAAHPYLIMEYLHGNVISEQPNTIKPGVFTKADAEAVCAFIKAGNTFDLNAAQEKGLSLESIPSFTSFEETLTKHGTKIISALGKDMHDELLGLLESRRPLLERHEGLLSFDGDVNFSNMTRMPDGKLGLFDFERVCVNDNPAFDYGFMLNVLHADPAMQRTFLETTLDTNRYVPDFREYLRLSTIYDVALREVRDGYERGDFARIATYKQQIRNPIEGKGIWAKAIII